MVGLKRTLALFALLCAGPALAQALQPQLSLDKTTGTLSMRDPVTGASRKLGVRTLDVRDFATGAPACTGANTNDDAPAFAAALAAASSGDKITFPAGCYINTTVNVTKSVTIAGDGPGASLYIPSVTGFTVNAGYVTFRDFFVYGNRSSSSANMLFAEINQAATSLYNLRGELLNTFADYQGGFFHIANGIRLRNLVQTGFHLEGYGGAEGVELLASHIQYDTDGTWYGGTYDEPTKSVFWVQDFDGLVLNSYDLIHGGQIANIWINPVHTRSGDHLIGNGYLDLNPVGEGIRFEPIAGTKIDRTNVTGAWIASQTHGVRFTGAGQIEGVNISGNWIYNQQQHAVLFDNTNTIASTITLRSNVFSANGASANGAYSDIKIAAANALQSFSITANIFNDASALTSNRVIHNVDSAVARVVLTGTDFTNSSATGEHVLSTGPIFSGGDDFVTATIAAGGSLALSPQSGELIVTDTSTTGDTCMYLLGGPSVGLLGQSLGTTCVTGSSPGAAQLSVGYSGGSYSIFNGSAAARTVNYRSVRTRAAN